MGTSSPRSMMAVSCLPRAEPDSTSARRRSPVDKCVNPYCATMRSHCVPLPEPGPPAKCGRGHFSTWNINNSHRSEYTKRSDVVSFSDLRSSVSNKVKGRFVHSSGSTTLALHDNSCVDLGKKYCSSDAFYFDKNSIMIVKRSSDQHQTKKMREISRKPTFRLETENFVLQCSKHDNINMDLLCSVLPTRNKRLRLLCKETKSSFLREILRE